MLGAEIETASDAPIQHHPNKFHPGCFRTHETAPLRAYPPKGGGRHAKSEDEYSPRSFRNQAARSWNYLPPEKGLEFAGFALGIAETFPGGIGVATLEGFLRLIEEVLHALQA